MANSFNEIAQDAKNLIKGIKEEVNSLEKSLTGVATDIKNTFNSVSSQNKLLDQIKEVNSKLDEFGKVSKKVSNERIKLAEKELDLERKKQIEIDKLWSARKKQKDEEAKIDKKRADDYNRALKEVQVEEKKAIAQKNKKIKASLKEADAIQKNREALQRQKAAYIEINRPYNQLIQKQKEAKKILEDLITTQGRNSKETRLAQKEYDKLSNRVNHANNATRNFSNSGLKGALSGVKNLIAAFGIIGGASMFASLVKDTFALTKTLDSMRFSMEAVIKDEIELAQTTGFLRRTAADYGADLVVLTNRYIKFRAATDQAGFSAASTQKIFSTMTKAAGVLGLKKDELQGVFLALEQMVSKGKVTTEELRRQLGERLPGAMDIMATSMGVTTATLDEMLKKGEVITADVLPKFAEQVEIAFGLENVKKVETLQAATARLSTAWTVLVEEWSQSEGVSSKLMKVIDFMADNLETIVSIVYKSIKAWAIYKAIVVSFSLIGKVYTATTTAMSIATALFRGGLKAARIEMIALNVATKANPLGILLSVVAAAIGLFTSFKDELNGTAEAQRLWNDELEAYSEKLKVQNTENISLLEEEIEKIKERNQERLKGAKSQEEEREINKEIANEQISWLKMKQENLLKSININEERLDNYRYSEKEIVDLSEESTDKQLLFTSFLSKKQRESIDDKVFWNKKAADEIEVLLQSEFDQYVQISGIIETISKQKKKQGGQDEFLEGSVGYYKELISQQNKLIEKQKDRSVIKNLQKQNDEWQKQIDLLLGVEKKIKKIKEAKDILLTAEFGSTEFIKQQISYFEELDGKLKKNSEDWYENAIALDFWRRKLQRVTKLIEEVKEDLEPIDPSFIFSQEEAEAELKRVSDLLHDFHKGFQDEFFSEAGFDFLGSILGDPEKFKDLLDASKDDWAVWANAIMEVSQEAFNFINQQGQASFNAEYERLEQQRDVALQFAGESTAAQEQIQEQYEARRKAIQQRQARSQKQQAIVNTIFNTAQGIVSALAQVPKFDGGISATTLAAIIGGIGAAQIALIASTPLPEFFRGTQNAPEGWALVDEKQPEVHTDRHGNVKSMGENKANVRWLDAGDKIYSSSEEYFNKELKNILNGNDISSSIKLMDQSPVIINQESGFTASQMDSIIAKHFSNIKTQNTIIDKNGVQTYISKGNSRTIELNNRVSFKGISV